MKLERLCLVLFCFSQFVQPALGDAGVLIPSSDTNKPDPKKLSLADMQVSILVDNQNAQVSVRQIFASHVGAVLEGKYLFGINPDALISDFAVWDGPVRIPGVILERKRAEEIYDALRLQSLDPGLLQRAEQDEEGGSRASFFSARITPIPAYGTKRLELEYSQQLPLERLQSYFYFPLKPREFQNQSATHLRIDVIVRHAFPVTNFRQTSPTLPLIMDRQTSNEIQAHYEGNNVNFTDDFAFTYELKSPSNLSVLFYRAKDDRHTRAGLPVTAFDRPAGSGAEAESGYFQATAVLNLGNRSGGASGGRRSASVFFLLFDTSLSIRWDKLERQYEALEKVLNHLQPQDHFQLVLFNSKVVYFRPSPIEASRQNIAAALDFVKNSYLVGGTDLKQALQTALEQQAPTGFTTKAVLISDGNPTLGSLGTKKIARWFASANNGNGRSKLKLYAYGIGSDCNKVLLRELAQESGGLFEFVSETEATDFKLTSFVEHLTIDPLTDPRLEISGPENFTHIYHSPESPIFDQGMAQWVGQYRRPSQAVTFTASAHQAAGPIELKRSVNVPEQATEHLFIPRNWAKARVDFLLQKIEMDGEDADSVSEIIRLSKKYKFVTPYTSLLAAPRSLLRPRLIKPGDPILRVRTDRDITAILAIFPFGLTKHLRYLPGEQVWQLRFLAPKEMVDGAYQCRLILRDKAGLSYEEKKSFVIDSRAPALAVSASRRAYRPGETVQVNIKSDPDTRRIRLRLAHLMPVEARWDAQAKMNVGYLPLPAEMATGEYSLEVFAEDFAHNVSRGEAHISVVR
jgi:Ca-activated chloride channel family protein